MSDYEDYCVKCGHPWDAHLCRDEHMRVTWGMAERGCAAMFGPNWNRIGGEGDVKGSYLRGMKAAIEAALEGSHDPRP